MARYDKYDPKVGGFRASLAADYDPDDVEKCLGVGLDVDGHLVIGAGVSGIKGVLVLTKALKAGKRVDPMTRGEIVEFGPSDAGSDPGVDFGDPGTDYYADEDGLITSTAGGVYVGFTVEGQRLIVDVASTASAVSGGFAAGSIPVTALETTGTPGASTYLDGTGAWSTPA